MQLARGHTGASRSKILKGGLAAAEASDRASARISGREWATIVEKSVVIARKGCLFV
jgi:hypothetical protein